MTRGDLKCAGLITGYGDVPKNDWVITVDPQMYRKLAPKTAPVSAPATSIPAFTTTNRWQDDPATDRQIAYLVALGVRIERNMSKGRASELIDAARGGYLGSVGGYRASGDN